MKQLIFILGKTLPFSATVPFLPKNDMVACIPLQLKYRERAPESKKSGESNFLKLNTALLLMNKKISQRNGEDDRGIIPLLFLREINTYADEQLCQRYQQYPTCCIHVKTSSHSSSPGN